MSLLGIDIGTTGCKGIAFSEKGEILGNHYREYRLNSPQSGWYELHGDTVWESVKEVIRRINAYKEVEKDPVKALSVSVSGDEFVPVGQNNEILYPTIMSQDIRGKEEIEYLENIFTREKLYSITGLPAHPKYGINRMMWIKRNLPDIYKRAKYFLGWEDFIYLRLGIEPVTDYSVAARFMAFDIHNRKWSEDILDAAGIDKSRLAKVVPSGTCVGYVNKNIGSELGFKEKVSIVAGGFDQACAALGAGVTKPGTAVVGTGTMESMGIAFNKPVTSDEMLKNNYAWNIHVVKDMYICSSTNVGGGQILKWYRDTFGEMEKEEAKRRGLNVYDMILKDLPKIPSGLLVLPHFAGSGPPYKDPNSLGAILGLKIATKKNEFILGLLEGITFELWQNIENIERGIGYEIDEIRTVGGGAKSDFWVRLKSDMLNRVILRPEVIEAGCLAAAILAGTGIGIYSSTEEAAERLISIKDRFDPEIKRHSMYKPYFEEYKKVYLLVKDINHSLFLLKE